MSYVLEQNQQWQDFVINGKAIKAPSSWVAKKISDLAKTSIGSTPTKTGANYEGFIPWVTISDLKEKVVSSYSGKVAALKNVKILPAGSLIGSFKMSVGRFGFLSEASATNEAIIAITPSATKESLSYLYYILPNVFKSNASLNGQGLQLLNTQTIKGLSVLLPPLAEQTAIANILSDQEALVAHYSDLIALHEKRLAYLSDELLSGRLRLLKKQDSVVVECGVQNNWPVAKVKNLVSIFNGYPCANIQMGDDSVNGVPILKMSNIEGGLIVLLGEGAQTYFVDSLKTDCVPQHNDMLVGLSGSVGKSGVFKIDTQCLVNQRIAILRVKDAGLNQTFFNFVWNWSLVGALLKTIQSSTIANVSPADVAELSFFQPPIEEQTLIANVLSDQEALIAEYKKLRDAEKKRFDWLSDALLSGTYRVKVDA